jgi:AhpD family alkylhydroperoxidase
MAVRLVSPTAFLPLPGVQSRCTSTDELDHVSAMKLDPTRGQVGATVDPMTERITISDSIPAAFKAFYAASMEVEKAALASGLDQKLLELVKIRASQHNAWAFCLDMHTADALRRGEDVRRINLLAAWHETDLYSEQERAALALTETITRLAETRDVPDEVYEYATKVFTEAQYQAVVWEIMVINGYNRLAVPARPALPNR